MTWQVQEAKQRLSEVLRQAETDGDQTITRHGEPVAVVVGIAEYRRLRSSSQASAWPGLFPPLVDEEYAGVLIEVERSRAGDWASQRRIPRFED